MRKIYLILSVLLLSLQLSNAQELQAKVSIASNRVGSTVDKKVFNTLQTSLNNFLNNRKWTNDVYQQNEKIVCNFLVNISSAGDNNTFSASLTVQAARPIYNSSYDSPLINFIDDNLTFRYVEFQQLDFNENRVAGNDATAANLTAVLAYYVYIILGLDYDSYVLRGGDPYFQKAQNIVNNAPDGRDLAGWKAFDGQRNRYWLMENLTNNRYSIVHDAFYSYYRTGMDKMYEDDVAGRKGILASLNYLSNLNTQNPNLMITQFFFQGKSNELIKIFKKSPADEKARALDLLSQLDITNVNNYKTELK
ncbi:type IX secretion system protein PorD [Pinibacter aurantiacus]|uniref:DUF4835 family protein n=1 Tax=Pinibacter aurantiacus TaxID=2851599 RepID=A0A9E2S919_9BACT|nr:DUF4835 family protein [Pinibacter aurantiacus]MBV4358136.1 DUF4835 family protein [Pinibacter aurantiacus]